jgi:hypothetical protein
LLGAPFALSATKRSATLSLQRFFTTSVKSSRHSERLLASGSHSQRWLSVAPGCCAGLAMLSEMHVRLGGFESGNT